jgi:outer membrane receptor for ferric coprogen and ferric-rhodotorulic acid
MAAEWLALRSEYRFDKQNRAFIVGNGDDSFPQSIATHHVPLSASFFHPSGLFTRLTGTYLNQHVANVTDFDSNPLSFRREGFWTFDTALGYRFPKRLGTINFEVTNLFNSKFNYQSNFDSSGPQMSPFIPERQLFVKLSLFY